MIANYEDLPAKIQLKVIDYMTEIEEGRDTDIEDYIKENPKYSDVFEELWLKCSVKKMLGKNLFDLDDGEVDLFNELDYQRIRKMAGKKDEKSGGDRIENLPDKVIINGKAYILKSCKEVENLFEIEGYNLFEQSEEIKNIKLIFSDKSFELLNIEEKERDKTDREDDRLSAAASSKDLVEDKNSEEKDRSINKKMLLLLKKNFNLYKGPYSLREFIIEFYYRQESSNFIPVYIRIFREGMS